MDFGVRSGVGVGARFHDAAIREIADVGQGEGLAVPLTVQGPLA